MVEIRQRSRHILQKDNCGFGLGDDSPDVGPEVAGVVSTAPLAGDGEGVAGEPSADKINSASPRASVEGAEVRPDRGTIQPSVLHSPNEHVLAERVRLAVGGGVIGRPKGEAESEVEPADPRAEREAIHRSAPQKASKSFT